MVERTGNKVALSFWQIVGNHDRWPRGKTAPDSPLRALYRLYGEAGPLYALGIPPGSSPTEITAATYPSDPDATELTMGTVRTGGGAYRYALLWWLRGGKPLLAEVMPSPHPLALPPPRGETAELAARLHEWAPTPGAGLDDVAQTIWHTQLERAGLPFTVRCLATWWRVQGAVDYADSPTAVAAAVTRAVARATGAGRGPVDVLDASAGDVDRAQVEQVTRELGDRLELDRRRGW